MVRYLNGSKSKILTLPQGAHPIRTFLFSSCYDIKCSEPTLFGVIDNLKTQTHAKKN